MFFPSRPLFATWSWSLVCLTLNSLEAGGGEGGGVGAGMGGTWARAPQS